MLSFYICVLKNICKSWALFWPHKTYINQFIGKIIFMMIISKLQISAATTNTHFDYIIAKLSMIIINSNMICVVQDAPHRVLCKLNGRSLQSNMPWINCTYLWNSTNICVVYLHFFPMMNFIDARVFNDAQGKSIFLIKFTVIEYVSKCVWN